MTINRRNFLAACLGAGAFAMAGWNSQSRTLHNASWNQFGTRVDVMISDHDIYKVDSALKELAAGFETMNHNWHPWKPGQIGDVNNAIRRGGSAEIDGHLAYMISEITGLYLASAGTYNPAIGNIVSAWGFHGERKEDWVPPSHELIDSILATNPSPLDLHVADNRVFSNNAAVKLDLSGYARGYALSLGVRVLQAAGVEHAVIKAGGDIIAMGHRYDTPWRIGIKHPQGKGNIALLETLGTEAVFTSGNMERFNEHQGKRYHHIIDPRTGNPTQSIASATVINPNAALADAAATALVVAGKDDWRDIARAMGIEYAMIIDERGAVQATSAMKERLLA